MCSSVGIKEIISVVTCSGFCLVQLIMGDPHNWFQEYGKLVGFALLFFFGLIVSDLDVGVLGCMPKDPSIAWQSWKTQELNS